MALADLPVVRVVGALRPNGTRLYTGPNGAQLRWDGELEPTHRFVRSRKPKHGPIKLTWKVQGVPGNTTTDVRRLVFVDEGGSSPGVLDGLIYSARNGANP